MNLFIKQRVFSWGQKFDVFDQNGEVLFYVKGDVLTIGRKLHIFNKNGTEVVYIKQRLLSFMPKYEIYINDELVDTLVRKFTFFSHNYYFKNRDWEIKGQIMAHNYAIYAGNSEIMNLNKKWFSWGDTYDIEIKDSSNTLLCLAASIIIDCVCHEGKH